MASPNKFQRRPSMADYHEISECRYLQIMQKAGPDNRPIHTLGGLRFAGSTITAIFADSDRRFWVHNDLLKAVG